jgi:hypothetical protein
MVSIEKTPLPTRRGRIWPAASPLTIFSTPVAMPMAGCLGSAGVDCEIADVALQSVRTADNETNFAVQVGKRMTNLLAEAENLSLLTDADVSTGRLD